MTYRMTPDAMREAIARAEGWITYWEPDGPDEVDGHWEWHKGSVNTRRPPNYPADLNAMHEAEQTLLRKGDEWGQYTDALMNVIVLDGGYGAAEFFCHATAAQRAEAFCRTVPCDCGCGLTIWECSESKAKEGGK